MKKSTLKNVPSVDTSCFMVATQEKEFVRASDFVGEEIHDDFNAVHSTIHVVTHKQERGTGQMHP
jgi:hypothetical protein